MKLDFKNFNGVSISETQVGTTTISTEFQKIEKGYICVRKIKNRLSDTIALTELSMRLVGITFVGDASDDYFYCNENNRLYGTMTLPVDYDRENPTAPSNDRFRISVDTKYADSGTIGKRICASPYQPFPAISISNYRSSKGIIIGSLSQEVFFHNFEVGHIDGYIFADIYSSFKDVAYRELKPNEELTDVFCILETEHADDIDRLFEDYSELLREVLSDNRGAARTNRHTLIWDSWNDGIFRNVSEKMLLEEARAVKELFPTVEWFQLDDGYSSFCEKNPDLSAHGLGVAYEGEAGIDAEKFPEGLKAYAEKVKQVGLKPAIWIGGFCPVQSKIYQEHPEWFLDYSYRVDFSQPLDVSLQESRTYMTYALDALVSETGFEGVKLDFWSYAFEDSHDLLRNKERSGYEYREWWHNQLSRRIPSYGYLQTGCDVCTGNPFIGKYFNNYRFGLDVGAGSWENIKTTMFWGMAVLSTHTGDIFIPNSDSIGVFSALDDTDFMFWVNYQIITRTLVEISGRFSQKNIDKKRLEVIQQATKYLNNGENVYFPRYDYRKSGCVLPKIIYIDSAFNMPTQNGDLSIKTVALFNPEETTERIAFAAEDIGLQGEMFISDVWEGGNASMKTYFCDLPPHGSKLLLVKKR